jgi:DNA-binding CsgD family transcriptional regulator
VEAGDYSAALELAAQLREADPQTRARVLLAETRALRELGDRAAAERALAAGLDAARGSRTAAEVGLLLEEVAMLIQEWNSAALSHAAAALDLAQSVGTARARAQLMFAFAVGDHDSAALGLEHARDALEMARDEGDGSLECEAAHVLADCLITTGRASEAYALVIAMVERARELGLRSREFELLNVQAYLELHVRGDVEKANELCRVLLREPVVLGSHGCRTYAYLAFGLALLGGDREATEMLDEAARGAMTADDRAAVADGRAEVELLAGRYTTALAAAQECMNENTPFAWQATRLAAWAAFELGQDQPPQPHEPPPDVIAACVPEVHALSCLADGRSTEAEALFHEAAGAWQGRFVQGELRCLLGVGLSALQGGAGERAREALLEAERMARRGGFEPLLARVRRSLRQAGVTAAAPRRPASGLLTGREREVLGLVGAGLRTREIAARLGVAPSTVNSQVKSAMRKLGTRTRAQAAIQAADDPG